MKYVALLRGINVGGGRKVDMKQLRAIFESLGHESVKTYINSGNVLFDSSRPAGLVVEELEKTIMRQTGLEVKVLLRTSAQIAKLVAACNPNWTNDHNSKTDVLFLWPEVDSPTILQQLGYKPEIETMLHVPGAVLWNIDRTKIGRSSLLRIVGTPLYKAMTIRNINTLRKLHDLMSTSD